MVNVSVATTGILDVYIPGADSCWMRGVFGRGYDVGCIVKSICRQGLDHINYIYWLLVLVPIFCLLIIRGVYWLNNRQKRITGYYLFGNEYNYWGKKYITTRNDYKIFEYGFESFDEFRIFVFKECLLFMALAGAILLYLNGTFS